MSQDKSSLDRMVESFAKLYRENSILKTVFPETENACAMAMVESVRDGVEELTRKRLLDPGAVHGPAYREETIPWERVKAGFALQDSLALSYGNAYPDYFDGRSNATAQEYAEAVRDFFPTNFDACVWLTRVAQARA